MLFPHWPYRVPNQELTIINSIFYNRMQRWVSSSIFCRYRSTIRNFDCYLSSLFQQKVISVRIWRIIYLPIASQWCIEVLQPSFYMVQYRHDGLGGCGFETDSRRRAKISTKKWANNFRASFFFSKLRYINTLVVRFSNFSENSLILFYVVKCNIIYGTTNLCYLHFLAHSGGSGIFRFFVYKKITSKE